MKIRHKKLRKGFLSTLTVIVVGGFCLGLMAVAYRYSIRSVQTQSKVQLQIDYENREQAYLRSLVTMWPVFAANTMQDNSVRSYYKDNVYLRTMYNTAGDWAGMETAVTNAEAAQFGYANYIRGNTADTSYTRAAEYMGFYANGTTDGNKSYTLSGVNHTSSGSYPPPYYIRGSASSSLSARSSSYDSNIATWNNFYPIISSAMSYSTTGTPHSDLAADVSTYGHFNLIPYPNIHFGYGKPGESIVARHHWWRIFMHPELKDSTNTGVTRETNADGQALDREYILSLYEIPSQLAISSSTVTQLGKYLNGQEWGANVSVEGSVYADKVNAAAGSFDSIASKKGVTLSGGSAGSSGEVTSVGAYDREIYEAANATFYPVSKSSDTARALFVSINRGNDFFDRFAYSYDKNQKGSSSKRMSYEHWHEYSLGCNQCAMKLDIISTVSALDQTPTALRFTYLSGGDEVELYIYKPTTTFDTVTYPGINWPEATDNDGLTFPFHLESTGVGRDGIAVYIDRLVTWMGTLSTVPDDLSVNHSLVVNADYNQTDVSKPTIPSTAADPCLLLRGSGDLTAFTKGFSLVTNLRLYFVEHVNNVETNVPTGSGLSTPYYPPLSIFCPEKRFGVDSVNTAIDMTGSVGTLGTSSSGIGILDFKIGGTDVVDSAKIKAKLKPIKHPAELPPVNMMNWLIVVQRVHEGEYSDY